MSRYPLSLGWEGDTRLKIPVVRVEIWKFAFPADALRPYWKYSLSVWANQGKVGKLGIYGFREGSQQESIWFLYSFPAFLLLLPYDDI